MLLKIGWSLILIGSFAMIYLIAIGDTSPLRSAVWAGVIFLGGCLPLISKKEK